MGALCRYRVIESKELASVLMQMLEAASKQAKGGWLDLILDSTLNCLLISNEPLLKEAAMDYSTILESLKSLMAKREAFTKNHNLAFLIDENNMLISKWHHLQKLEISLNLSKIWLTASDDLLPKPAA